MPLDGWDYLELWVGNARQAARFYEHVEPARLEDERGTMAPFEAIEREQALPGNL